jgi:hypothetical protein
MAFSKSASFTFFGYSIDIEKIRIKAIAIICKYLRSKLFSSTSEAYNRDDLPLERIELRIFKA